MSGLREFYTDFRSPHTTPSLDFYKVLRNALFCLPPEFSHLCGLGAIQLAHRTGCSGLLAAHPEPAPVEAMGLRFAHPVGLAAGLDKDARCVSGLLSLGFSFIEVGTVTPAPQPGNPRPRLFRLPRQQALINRMGFNSCGLERMRPRLLAPHPGIVGVNLGLNRDTAADQAPQAYRTGMRAVCEGADYIAINLSSPNTPGLREWQRADRLEPLLEALLEEREQLAAAGKRTPLAIKLSPDLEDEPLRASAQLLRRMGVDAVIAGNTTVQRPGLEHEARATEAGGLSGAPLRQRGLEMTRILAAELGPGIPIIATGGIADARAAAERIEAGARLVQLYTGFIYGGPALITASAAAIAALQRDTRP